MELRLIRPQDNNIIKRYDTGVILHLYYPDMWNDMLPYLLNLGKQFDLFVTIPYEVDISENTIKENFPNAQIRHCENRGRDIAPFLVVFSAIAKLGYKYICKVHTKKSPHIANGIEWQQDMLRKLLGSRKIISQIKKAFDKHPDWGLIAPQGHVVPYNYFWGQNATNVIKLAHSVGIPTDNIEFSFVAGSMFWFRPQAFDLLLKTGILTQDFDLEQGQQDSTLAHAFERFFGMAANYVGYKIAESDSQEVQLSDISFQFRILIQAFQNQEQSVQALTAQVVEKEQSVQALTAQVVEKEQAVQALTAQVAEKEQSVQTLTAQLTNILFSKAWKFTLILRQIRVKLLPPGSRREKPARWVYLALKIWRREGLRRLTRKIIDRLAGKTNGPSSDYQDWILNNEPRAEQLAAQRAKVKDFNYKPLISVIVPVWNTPAKILDQTIRSVIAQTYPNWELCLVDGNSSTPGVKVVLNEMEQADPRVHVRFIERNLGISGNSNEALMMAQGEFVALLDHDDLLAPNMLYEVVALLNQNPDAGLIYFDEDKISEDGRTRREPWFKPQSWSPDLLLSVNYFMHSLFRRTLVQDVGGFDPTMDGAQDWDLALRCTEKKPQIYHIPHILYHWRQVSGSAASVVDAKPWAFEAQVGCIQAHLRRLGVQHAQVVLPSLGQVRVLWPTTGAKVSIIIPSKDKVELLQPCLTSLLTLTSYPNYEIIVVDTGSTQAETHRYYADLATEPRVHIVKFTGTFNYSVVNNFGVTQATGDLLLFLNNDTQILEADWLTELAGWAERPEVGIVGCKLIRPNGTIQHAGIIMGLEGHGSHVFEGNLDHHYGPFGSSEWVRDYHAVTGACLMMRRAVFEQVGGFDPAYQIGYGDIDLCLRTVEADYRVVYTPFARVLHHEGGTRGLSLPASDVLRASCTMFSMIQAGDTFYNPNLSYNQRRTAITVPGEESRTERLFRILTQFDLVNPNNPQVQQISPIALPVSTCRPNSELARKLLLVSHDLSLSGAPLILYHLARYLVQNGFTITVLSSSDGPINKLYAQANIKVVIEPAALDDARVLAALIVKHGLVLANTILTWRAVHAAHAFKRPCVWWIHESQFGQQLATTKRQVADAFTIADKIVFPTKTTAALYAGFCVPNNVDCFQYGLDVPTPEVLPNGFEKKPNKFYVVNIASVERRKGQDVLLESIAMLPNDIRSQFEVYLVGRVLEQAYYRALAKRFKDLKNVHFIGEVNHPTALAYLQFADLFALPSRDEVLPIILLEAMALGKGIVVSRVGGIAEVIEHGINGQLVEPANVRALAQSLELLYNNREYLAQLGCQAQATFTERLTLAHSGQEFIRLLKGLADQAETENAGH